MGKTSTNTQIDIRLVLWKQDAASCRFAAKHQRTQKPENKSRATSTLPRVSHYLNPWCLIIITCPGSRKGHHWLIFHMAWENQKCQSVSSYLMSFNLIILSPKLSNVINPLSGWPTHSRTDAKHLFSVFSAAAGYTVKLPWILFVVKWARAVKNSTIRVKISVQCIDRFGTVAQELQQFSWICCREVTFLNSWAEAGGDTQLSVFDETKDASA